MNTRMPAGLLLALMAALASPASAQTLPNLDARATTVPDVSPGRTHELLTTPSNASPEAITLRYVRDALGLDTSDLDLVSRSVSPDGITHLRYNQVLDGILAYDHGIDAHVTADGRLIDVTGRPVPGARLDSTKPSVSALAGLGAARRATGGLPLPPRVDRSSRTRATFSTGEAATLRWTATPDGARLAWDVFTESDGNAYSVLVDAETSKTLVRTGLTHQLGRVRYFPRDPDTAGPIEITMPPSWYDEHNGGTRLWGQYSRTYIDPIDEDPAPGSEQGGSRIQIPASGGAPGNPDWLYTRQTFPAASPCPPGGCSWNSDLPASRSTNQFQAGANVHALVGHFVEYLARAPIGFDEASGNFQRVNTGGAGRGGDYIRTEVNDGQGLNNANFSTPADGLAPRMQMFLFTVFDTNGSESADVVYHEIGHGLSNRLVVNASGVGALGTLQSSMMGEAWSDFYAMDLLVHEGHLTDTAAPGEIRTGTHVVGPNGVRSKPIDCPVNPAGIDVCNRNGTAAVVLGGYTYGDIKDTNNPPVGGPHNGGEVWAETLWDIRTAVGHEAALALITGGLRMTPDNPSMLDARDAILLQALAMRSASGAADDYYARLWGIFQSRGMGFDASTPNANSETPTESFTPPRHQVSLRDPVLSDPYPGGDNDGRTEPGERVEVSASVFSPGLTDLSGVTGTLSSADARVTIVDGNAAWPLLGNGRALANSDSLVARMPASCETVVPLTVSVTSGVGAATVTANADPRGASRTTVALADTPTNGVPAVTEATYVVTGGGTITDVNARIDDLRHSFLGDLKIELVHDGVTVTLFEPPGGYNGRDIVGAVFDSDSANPVVNAGAGPVSGTMRPQNPTGLNQFDGHPASGVWTLRITDDGVGDSGVLREWGVQGPVSEFPCPRLEIPEATTGAAAAVTVDSATVNGAVVPRGRATGLRFAYGETATYGSSTPTQDAGAGESSVPRTATLSGLKPGTTYHYRAEAIRENGQLAVAGNDATFTTAPTPVPEVVPAPAPAPDRIAPAFTGRTRVTLARGKRTSRRRATFAFSLSEPATVTATVTRATPGIRRGSRCVAVPRRTPRGARPCTRQVSAAKGTVRLTRAGAGTLRLPARGLGKGRYTATLTGVDAAGNRSTATVRFTVR